MSTLSDTGRRRDSCAMRFLPAVALLALTIVVAGCGSGGKAGQDKAGARTVTLRLLVGDRAGTSAEALAQAFAAEVQRSSGGAVRVDVSVSHAPLPSGSYPADTIRAAAAGRADGVVTPSRGWAGLGVRTLLPLEIPMLIRSDATLAAVLADPVADDMLAGVRKAAFEPLALASDGLQYLVAFGYAAPLVSAAAFDKATVRVPASPPVYAALRALGARPSFIPGFRAQTLARLGRIAATVSESARLTSPLVPGTVAANVPFGANTLTIALTHTAWERLDGDQRDAVRSAATSVARSATGAAVAIPTAARELCRLGLGVEVADGAAEADLGRRLESAGRSFISAPAASAITDRIRSLAAGSPAPPVVTCSISKALQSQVIRPRPLSTRARGARG